MKTSFIFSLSILLFLSNCQSEDIEATKDGCSMTKVATNISTLASTEMFNIQNIVLSGNTLSVTFSYGGGCDPHHSFQLFVERNHQMSTNMPYFDGRVIFSTTDYCKRLDTKTFCFDLTALKKEAKSGKINIQGWKESIDF